MDNYRDLHIDIIESTEQVGTTPAVKEVTQLTCGAGNTAGLNGKAVTLYDSATTTVAYFFDVNSSGVAAPVGVTRSVRVNVLSTDLNTAVATKLSTAMNSDALFTKVVAGAVVTITNAVAGSVPNATTNTGWTIATTTQGVNAVSVAPPPPSEPNRLKFYTQMGAVRYEDSLGRLFAHPTFGSEILVGASQGYPTIMSAISVANPGDRIKILNGTYNEDIVINKANLAIIGEGKGSIINGNVSFTSGGNACYITNVYFQKNITFGSGTLYNELIGNWCATGTTISDGTVVTSATNTYKTYAKEDEVFSYYAKANTIYNTFATYSANLPTRASISAVAATFASATITTNTLAYVRTTYKTYAKASSTFNATARATKASATFAYADTTYQAKATGTKNYNVKATGATTYSAKATASTTSSVAATAAGTFGTYAFSTYDGATFTADTLGIVGNSISLDFNGTDTIDIVVDAWNAIPANSANQVSFSGRPGTDVLIAGSTTLIAGSTGNPVAYTADVPGVTGNSISLVFDGIETIGTVTGLWNGGNVGNEVSHNGNPNGVPPAGTVTLAGGSSNNAVTFTAVTAGIVGNSISLVFNGDDTIQMVVDSWNGANTGVNEVSFTGNASSIVAASTVTLAGGTAGNSATFTAVTPGANGNTIALIFNGTTDTIASVTTAWNAVPANSSNQVAFTGSGGGVPVSGTITLAGGVSNATSTFTASIPGVTGNTIALTFNGTTDTLTSVTAAWNAVPANSANQVTFTGNGAGIPTAGTTTLSGGAGATAVRFRAENPGVNGNSISLVFNGTQTILSVVSSWNGINTGNRVLTSGPDAGIPPAGTVTLTQGLAGATYTFVANTTGVNGNNISLVFDGNKTLTQVVSDWNTAPVNAGNQVTVTVGTGTNILIPQIINLTGGATTTAVKFTADKLGVGGNSISLVFNGSENIQTVVNRWNSGNAQNTVAHNGNPLGVVAASTVSLTGGLDATPISFIAITGGVNGNSISLTFNGTTDTVLAVTDTWNSGNPINQVMYSSAQTVDGLLIPDGVPAAGTYTLAHGANNQTITFAADTIGVLGNNIALRFEFEELTGEVVIAWNAVNNLNTVSQNSDPLYQIPPQNINLSGGSDAGPFRWIAVTPGVIGNSITIVTDGLKTIGQIQTEWNGIPANALNQVTNDAAVQSGIPAEGTYVLFNGIDSAPISFTAATPGTIGNSISLVFNGLKNIDTVVTAWNAVPANASNQVVSPGAQLVLYLAPQTINLSGGLVGAPITFTAVTPGVAGNSISLVFNGTQNVGTVVDAWNAGHQLNQVSATGLPTGIVAASTVTLSGGSATLTYMFTAQTIGSVGNTISLVWNGSNTIDAVVNAWNAVPANSANKVGFTGGSGTFIPPTPLTTNLTGGVDSGIVTFTAATSGNGFTLVFDGVKTIDQVVTEWNTQNPASPVTYVGAPDGICPPSTVRLIINASNNMWVMIGD